MTWWAYFTSRVTAGDFFGRFIPGFDASRPRKYKCLFHSDSDPSMSIDPGAGVFNCFGCGASGGLLEFFARLRGLDLDKPDQHHACIEALHMEFEIQVDESSTGATDIEDLPELEGEQARMALAKAREHFVAQDVSADVAPVPTPISEEVVAKLASALWAPEGERARRFLMETRGITEETLRRFQIGWDAANGRIAFPVRDEAGEVVNIRLYSPTADSKFIAYRKGYGRPTLYPLQALADASSVILAEGELDALTLIQAGIPAVTATGGAKIDWGRHRELAGPFKGRTVTIAYDRGESEPGVAAAREIAAALMEEGAAEVRILEWPDEALAACGGTKVDVNDYFMKARSTKEDLQALLDSAKTYTTAAGDEGGQPTGTTGTPATRESTGDSHDAEVDEAAASAAARDAGKGPAGPAGGAGADKADVLGAEARLDARLWNRYFRVTKSGVVVGRKGVPIAEKAFLVVDFLVDKGARFFFFESAADAVFVIDGRWHTVFPEDEAFGSFWHQQVRLFGMKTSSGLELIEAVAAQVRMRPDCVRVARPNWGHLDWKSGTLYLCLDPGQASIVRVRPACDGNPVVEELPNGTDGVLLKCPSYRARRFHYIHGAEPFEGIATFRDLIHRQQALDEVERTGSTAYKLAALLPGLAQRPIGLHQGGEHSGKTSDAQDFETMVYGEKRASGFNRKEELWTALDGAGPLVTQDNAESKTRAKFGDSYNRLSTGVSSRFRKLYTNSIMIDCYPNASLILTAIESFSMPEDIDRAIEFRFDVKHHDRMNRPPRTEHLNQIREQGDRMLSAILNVLSVVILPGLEESVRRAQAFILEKRPGHPKERFNEYLAIMALWFEAIGGLLWDEQRAGRPFDAASEFLAFLDGQRDIHLQNAVAASKEVLLLDAIRLEMGSRNSFDGMRLPGVFVDRGRTGGCTIGPVTTNVLFTAFSIAAAATGMRALPWEGPRQLGQRMAAAARRGGALEQAGWTRELAGTAHDNNPLYKYVYAPPVHALPDDRQQGDGAAQAGGANGAAPKKQEAESSDRDADLDAQIGEWLSGG